MSAAVVSVIFGCVAGAAFGWSAACNVRTYLQRKAMLERMYYILAADSYLREFHRVPYEAHFWRLLTFRDPLSLYAARIRSLAEAAQ